MGYLGYKPADKPLTSADITDSIITSAKITDATIVNGDIANSTINLTTKVTGSLPIANGGTGLTALGTANQVLAVNSGATALEYQAVSSDYVLLATTNVTSSTASVSFDGYFSSTYRNYKLIISNATPVNNSTPLLMRFRRSNADVTSTNYFNVGIGGRNYQDNSFEVNNVNGYSEPGFYLTGAISNVANWSASVDITLYNPLSTSYYKTINWITNYVLTVPQVYTYANVAGGGLRDSTDALSGVTFYFNSGNISNGNFKLYGIK